MNSTSVTSKNIQSPINFPEKNPFTHNIETNYQSLFKRFKDQDNAEVFAHFPWNDSLGENWDTTFEKLAGMAQPEHWGYVSSDKNTSVKFSILKNYLNYTFLRLQQEKKIKYSEDGKKACFNTGLQTTSEKDIFAFFQVSVTNTSTIVDQIDWTLTGFYDSFTERLAEFDTEPEVATYITNPADLVFNFNYDIHINVEHIVETNKDRLPLELQRNTRLAMMAIKGATEFLKERLKRNYKLAVPHWYQNEIQLLIPLNIRSSDKADLALVAVRDDQRKIYKIVTALTLEMAYQNARIICSPEPNWLNTKYLN